MNFNIEGFLRCGRLSLNDWLLLDEKTQKKLEDAAINLRNEFIGIFALAMQNPAYGLSLLSEVVGEDLVKQKMLDDHTKEAAEKLKKEKVIA